jgi:putative hydrolase of the HAD superfamily
MEKRLIIFDFFGVICSEIAPFWLEQYFSKEESVQIKADIVAKADRGEISEAEMMARLGARTGCTAQEVRCAWMQFAQIDPQMVALLGQLKMQYSLALLSNAPGEFLHRILSENQLYSYFEKIMISSEVRLAKPDPAIYRLLLKEMDITGEHCIMIDDNPQNLEGAAAAGIPGILFSSAAQLADNLASSGFGSFTAPGQSI